MSIQHPIQELYEGVYQALTGPEFTSESLPGLESMDLFQGQIDSPQLSEFLTLPACFFQYVITYDREKGTLEGTIDFTLWIIFEWYDGPGKVNLNGPLWPWLRLATKLIANLKGETFETVRPVLEQPDENPSFQHIPKLSFVCNLIGERKAKPQRQVDTLEIQNYK